MTTDKRDRDLGRDRKISRRDFLNGVAVGVGGAVAAQPRFAALAPVGSAPEETADNDPPAWAGPRGNHDGTFTYAHRLRDGSGIPTVHRQTLTGPTIGLWWAAHQRTGRRLLLSQECGRQGQHPRPGQPRRLRRARQAQ